MVGRVAAETGRCGQGELVASIALSEFFQIGYDLAGQCCAVNLDVEFRPFLLPIDPALNDLVDVNVHAARPRRRGFCSAFSAHEPQTISVFRGSRRV